MKKYKAIIVEDSRLARNELKELLINYEFIEIVAEVANVPEALIEISKQLPDILFLDINLPEQNGFDLLEQLDEIPLVVFTTAYDEFAIKSFEYNAFDYLLKPINQERFDKTIIKIIETLKNVDSQTSEQLSLNSRIFIKDGEDCWMIAINDIKLFEIVGNYTRVYFNGKKALTYKSLQKVEKRLPSEFFFRVNRQQIINLSAIEKVVPWFDGKLQVTLNNQQVIEVSRRQSLKFKKQLEL